MRWCPICRWIDPATFVEGLASDLAGRCQKHQPRDSGELIMSPELLAAYNKLVSEKERPLFIFIPASPLPPQKTVLIANLLGDL